MKLKRRERTYLGLHYSVVADAAEAAVIFGGDCVGRIERLEAIIAYPKETVPRLWVLVDINGE